MLKQMKFFYIEANGIRQPRASHKQALKTQEELKSFGVESEISEVLETVQISVVAPKSTSTEPKSSKKESK